MGKSNTFCSHAVHMAQKTPRCRPVVEDLRVDCDRNQLGQAAPLECGHVTQIRRIRVCGSNQTYRARFSSGKSQLLIVHLAAPEAAQDSNRGRSRSRTSTPCQREAARGTQGVTTRCQRSHAHCRERDEAEERQKDLNGFHLAQLHARHRNRNLRQASERR